MKKVLLITDVDFWKQGAGHRMRIAALVKHLALQFNLTVIYNAPLIDKVEPSQLMQSKFELIILEPEQQLDSLGYAIKVESFMQNRIFDCIIIEYIHNSYLLDYLPFETMVILDAHDIISDRSVSFKNNGAEGLSFEMDQDTEAQIFRAYDYVMALNVNDMQRIDELSGGQKSILCGHPVQVQHHFTKEDVNIIGFIASNYLPNIDAINYFILSIWPAIHQEFGLKLHIYGTICYGDVVKKGEGVELMGYADDLQKVYESADIIVNPVRYGAGLKIKNVEALANGKPLVTTSHGARGFSPGIGSALLVADTSDDFFKSLRSLIMDYTKRVEMSEQAIAFVRKSFSEGECFKVLDQLILTRD